MIVLFIKQDSQNILNLNFKENIIKNILLENAFFNAKSNQFQHKIFFRDNFYISVGQNAVAYKINSFIKIYNFYKSGKALY